MIFDNLELWQGYYFRTRVRARFYQIKKRKESIFLPAMSQFDALLQKFRFRGNKQSPHFHNRASWQAH